MGREKGCNENEPSHNVDVQRVTVRAALNLLRLSLVTFNFQQSQLQDWE